MDSGTHTLTMMSETNRREGAGAHGLKFKKERERKYLHSTGKKELTLPKLVSKPIRVP